MLEKRKKYLQVALNGTMNEAAQIISTLPVSDRIIVEAGTPLIKRYGVGAIRDIKMWWQRRLWGADFEPYVVADMKTMDRAMTEVNMAREMGANAVIALGEAPVETVNSFIEGCKKLGLDSMVDMMNVSEPIKVMRQWKKMPKVVILHRGVDEEEFNKDKPIPYVQINKIRSSFDVMISIGGGDTIREVQRAIFNDADIVMVWRQPRLAEDFLAVIK